MARHHRKYATKHSPATRPRANVCNVVYTPHPTADGTLVISPCKTPVERPRSRCPAHEAEYLESVREYMFWMEQGNSLDDPFSLSPQSVDALYDIDEIQMKLFGVKEAILVFSSEAMKRMVHWKRFYKDQDPTSLDGAELMIRIPLLKRKLEWLEDMEEKLSNRLSGLCKTKATAKADRSEVMNSDSLADSLARQLAELMVPDDEQTARRPSGSKHRKQEFVMVSPYHKSASTDDCHHGPVFTTKKVFVLATTLFALHFTGLLTPFAYPKTTGILSLVALVLF